MGGQGGFGGLPSLRRKVGDRDDVAIALGEDFIHTPFEDEATSIHDGYSVTDLFDLSKKMRAKYNGLTLSTHGVNHASDGRGAYWIHTGGGFVKDDEFGVMDNRLRQPDALQHTFRVGANRTAGSFGHRREFQRGLDGFVNLG
jgi:hypothetical protein